MLELSRIPIITQQIISKWCRCLIRLHCPTNKRKFAINSDNNNDYYDNNTSHNSNDNNNSDNDNNAIIMIIEIAIVMITKIIKPWGLEILGWHSAGYS